MNFKAGMDLQTSQLTAMNTTDTLPDRTSHYGSAWRCHDALPFASLGDVKAVSLWVIQVPWAQRDVQWWALGAWRLPTYHWDDGGCHPTHLMRLHPLGCEHGVDLLAPMAELQPVTFTARWAAISDLDAEEKLDQCVQSVLTGYLSPHPDFAGGWARRFNPGVAFAPVNSAS